MSKDVLYNATFENRSIILIFFFFLFIAYVYMFKTLRFLYFFYAFELVFLVQQPRQCFVRVLCDSLYSWSEPCSRIYIRAYAYFWNGVFFFFNAIIIWASTRNHNRSTRRTLVFGLFRLVFIFPFSFFFFLRRNKKATRIFNI
jgi:hypothetical protein